MGKQVEVKQNTFNGGISDSPRGSSYNQCMANGHFDIFSDSHKLIPYRDFEDDYTASSIAQYKVSDFASFTGSTALYGLGAVVATGFTKILSKATAQSGAWSLPATSEGNGARIAGCFVSYKSFLWGFQGTNQIWKWQGTTITNTVATVGATINSVAQGVIAKDDQLYLPYNNKLARVSSAGTVTDAVITLPSDLEISSLCNYGNYLAIGCRPYRASGNQSAGVGLSKVFLWNLTSPDVQETIIWGEGDLNVLEELDGNLLGILNTSPNTASLAVDNTFIVFSMYSGGTPQVIKTLAGGTAFSYVNKSKVKKNNRIFFFLSISYGVKSGSAYEIYYGVASFGRKDIQNPYALSVDIHTSQMSIYVNTVFVVGDYFFLTGAFDGKVWKTNDTESYTFTSYYESQVFDFGDSDTDKRLDAFKISFRKLRSGEVITLKYKVDSDADTAWTTFGTCTNDGDVSHTFLRDETNAVDFKSGKEFRFRIESTGGAEITGFRAKATILSNP